MYVYNFDSVVVASKRLRQINMILLWNDCLRQKNEVLYL